MIWRSFVAAVAGLLLAAAFEPIAWAVLAPVAIAILVLAVRGLSAPAAMLPGLCFGIAFQFVSLEWMRAVGPDAWMALASLEAAFYAALGSMLVLVARLPGWPVWSAAAWLTIEVWRGGWPFGGMPFGRVAFATVDTPLANALPWVGAHGTSLLVGLLGTTLAWLVVHGRRRPRIAVPVAAAAIALVALPVVAPYPTPVDERLRLAVVQGNVPGDGTDILLDHRQVTANHVQATLDLAADVDAGRRAAPEFVIWPENSTAVDPFVDTAIGASITGAARSVGVPLLVGTMVDGPEPDEVLNQGIVWDPSSGPGDRYTKRHPVPFGEFIPFRDSIFTRPFGKLRLIPRDMVPGDRREPLDIAGVAVADAICFDVAYDDVFHDQVARGAELAVVQTSNAMFIHTSQIEQQFAITRLRALETGRYAVVAATNGVTGVIAPDGGVVQRAALRRTAVLLPEVGLSDHVTPAVRMGPWLGRAAVLLTLFALAIAVLSGRRRRRRAEGPHAAATGRSDLVRTR